MSQKSYTASGILGKSSSFLGKPSSFGKASCRKCDALLGQLPSLTSQQLKGVARLVSYSSAHYCEASINLKMSNEGTSSSRTNDTQKQNAKFIKQETIHREKWLSLEKITYKDPRGKVRTWESVERTTKPQRPGVADAVAMTTIVKRLLHYDSLILVRQFRPPLKCYTIEFPAAVGMITVLKRLLHYDCLVLVRQFRPPLRSHTIEFPSGLVDNEETVAEAALRELKEETGYVGTITSISPVTAMDSGLSASTLNLVFIQVDGDDTVNQRPVPQLDEGEFVEVIHAPLHELKQKLDEYSEAGDMVDSRVYTYAATLHQCQHKGDDMDLEQQKGLYKK